MLVNGLGSRPGLTCPTRIAKGAKNSQGFPQRRKREAALTKNVRSWHGLRIGDNEVIFRDNATEVSRFRYRCHEFVRARYETEHDACFKKMKGRQSYGACNDRRTWKRLLKNHFTLLRGNNGSILIVHKNDGAQAEVYNPKSD